MTTNFSKPIDRETRKLLYRLARQAKNNRFKGKDPKKRMKPLLMAAFNNRCFWCDVECIDIHVERQKQPDNQATVDHVISRYFRKKGDEVLKVLACFRCNGKRSDYETRRYGRSHVVKQMSQEILVV